VFDVEGPQAKKTCRAFCELYPDGKTLVIRTHFAPRNCQFIHVLGI
jgi:hypothetical protein